MKKTIVTFVLSLFIIPLFAQDTQSGLPGDNLNLYGVLNLFQQSPTLEQFEKSLNAEDQKVNNLDLNNDGKIDYIHVVDNMNGDAHAIALRIDMNDNETQDVAVIEVERDANNQTHVQIVGDESLYGKDYIVEPNQNTPNPGYSGGAVEQTTVYQSPASWPIIDYMFMPSYVMYVSPFHWGYYPYYWHPWHPYSYDVYYGYHRPYYDHYRRSYEYRSPMAHRYYEPHRVYSPIIRERYHANRPAPIPGRRAGVPVRNSPPRVRPGVNPTSHPNNNSQPARTNQTPRTINNNPNRGNQTPRSNNNTQPARTNQTPRTINNQPARTNQTPRTINNNPNRGIQTPRPSNNSSGRSVPRQSKPVNNNNNKGVKKEEPHR